MKAKAGRDTKYERERERQNEKERGFRFLKMPQEMILTHVNIRAIVFWIVRTNSLTRFFGEGANL